MTLLLALHAVVGLGVMAVGGRLRRRAWAIAAVPPAAALLWCLWQYDRVVDGRPVAESVTWVSELGLAIDLRLDGFGLLLAGLVSGIGVLVLWYSRSYFAPDADGVGRLLGLLTLFSGSMLGLVLADHLLILYGFWELTSITSYLLIGNRYTDARSRAAALHALLVTAAGGLAMLGGFIVIGQRAGTYRLSEVLADPPTGTAVTAALVLVLLGAATKSAQYPFHSWLPGAMVAPTPVSAYLHSATMVKAGVYLVARFTPAFADVGIWRPAVVSMGIVTMVAGGLRALRQSDLKLLLAFGTVSQLGFLMVLFGMGTDDTVVAATEMLLAHALFKATLFLGVGIIDHQVGTRELALLPVLGRGWLGVKLVMGFAAAAMAGLPLTFGFIAKEEAYAALVEHSPFGGWSVVALVVVGSMLTFAYSARLIWGAFWYPRTHRAPEAEPSSRPSLAFLLAPLVTAGVLVELTLLPGSIDRFVTRAGQTLDTSVDSVHLAMWHGVNTPLVLSLVTMAGGVLLFLLRRQVARVLVVGRVIISGTDVYLGALRAMNRLADRVTGVVQSGSLPVYAGVILLVAAVLPVSALLFDPPSFDLPELIDQPAHLALAIVILGATFGASGVRTRFAAVLFLSMVGYGMAGLFVAQGAPDLALTQTAIETVTTVLFVLVLRRLPDRFERTAGALNRGMRVAVAAVVGSFVFLMGLYAANERSSRAVSDAMVDMAEPEGHGRNVVNVILVDFRGLDTMGEITVLAAAAIGAVALARAGRRPGDAAAPGDEALLASAVTGRAPAVRREAGPASARPVAGDAR